MDLQYVKVTKDSILKDTRLIVSLTELQRCRNPILLILYYLGSTQRLHKIAVVIAAIVPAVVKTSIPGTLAAWVPLLDLAVCEAEEENPATKALALLVRGTTPLKVLELAAAVLDDDVVTVSSEDSLTERVLVFVGVWIDFAALAFEGTLGMLAVGSEIAVVVAHAFSQDVKVYATVGQYFSQHLEKAWSILSAMVSQACLVIKDGLGSRTTHFDSRLNAEQLQAALSMSQRSTDVAGWRQS